MIEFWGSETCEGCKTALNFLQTTPFEFRYVDVATIQFEGEIPRLVFDDKTCIIGVQPVIQYVQEWMNQMGIRVV